MKQVRQDNPQEYIITDVKEGKPWSNGYGQFQAYGLALQGIGEPVRLNKHIPVANPPKVGDKLYGRLITEAAEDGREYLKLSLEARVAKEADATNIRWSIQVAVSIWIAQGCLPEAYDNIASEASHFYKMIDTIGKE